MNSNSNYLSTTRELFQPSSYHLYHIIDKMKIISLPNFICIKDIYFHQKQLYLNVILKKKVYSYYS